MKKRFMALLLILLTASMTACSMTSKSLTNNIAFQTNLNAKTDISSLSKASDRLGIDIFKSEALSGKNPNVIISPVSLFTAFTLLTNGAEGETKKQMKDVLDVDKLSDEVLNTKMNGLINFLNNSGTYKNTGFIRIYNSLWIDKGFKVKNSFLNSSKKYYDSDIFKEELATKSTIDDMNKWIKNKSRGLIKEPISEINDDTFMMIFNVLHFKGKWTNTFDKSKTKPDTFYLKSGNTAKIKMMNDKRFINYYEDSDVQAGVLNYYNGRMVILLPKGNIDDFISNLDLEKIDKYTKNTVYSEAKVKIPVFNVEYKENMSGILQNLGMTNAFNPNKADFSNLKDNNMPLWVGDVIHNCVVNVDEEGTEAAALSSVDLCGSALPKDIKEFYVNKPFVFLIQGECGNITLFIGKVENPR